MTERIRTEIRFFQRVAGLTLHDRVRSLTIQKDYGFERPLARMAPGWLSCIRCILLGGNPGTNPGPAAEIVSHSWLGNVWQSLRRSWNVWLVIEKSGLTNLACYHCDTHQEKKEGK